MEVSHKNNIKQGSLLCNICEDDGKDTHASGFCQECREYLCSACFDKHKKRSISRNHNLVPTEEADTTKGFNQDADFEKCTQHLGDLIKFYCPKHEQVGCGECMFLEHKTCNFEYIAKSFKDSREFKDLVRGAEEGKRQANQIATAIENNRKQASDINNKFITNVHKFSDGIISKINDWKDSVIKQAESMKMKDIENLDNIEKENEKFMKEMSGLTAPFEAEIDQPNKLFASFVQQKATLKRLEETDEGMRKKNSIKNYQFVPDGNLERAIKECKELGSLQVVTQEAGDKDKPESKASKAIFQSRQVVAASQKQNVYLLDPEGTDWTRTFVGKFYGFVGLRIKFEHVKSCSNCTRDYPIALLSIRHTDRPSEDIESILDHLKEEFYKRTVLIYIHVRHNRDLLPRIATKVKVSMFGDVLGDILDFGLIGGRIEACVYDGVINSQEALNNFVMAGTPDFTPKRGYNSLS